MKSKEEAKVILGDLLQRSPDVKSALIATSDGITITSINLDDKSNRLAAMAAASLGLGKQVISTVFKGELNEITVSGNNGKVFVYSISTTAVMVVVTKELPNVAMVNWEAQKTISQLIALQ